MQTSYTRTINGNLVSRNVTADLNDTRLFFYFIKRKFRWSCLLFLLKKRSQRHSRTVTGNWLVSVTIILSFVLLYVVICNNTSHFQVRSQNATVIISRYSKTLTTPKGPWIEWNKCRGRRPFGVCRSLDNDVENKEWHSSVLCDLLVLNTYFKFTRVTEGGESVTCNSVTRIRKKKCDNSLRFVIILDSLHRYCVRHCGMSTSGMSNPVST
jgi:hypothetical protein